MFQNQSPVFLAFAGIAIFGVLIFASLLLNMAGAALRQKFKARPLMNKPESTLYRQLVQAAPFDWVVMCQVSYGAFLSNKDRKRYWTINAKRADFIITDGRSDVLAVIEYQGSGHFGSSNQSRVRAEKSDATKRRATAEAGIPFFEFPKDCKQDDVIQMFQTLVPAPAPELERA